MPRQIRRETVAILGKISSRDNCYRRVLFVHAAELCWSERRTANVSDSSPGSKPPKSGCMISNCKHHVLTGKNVDMTRRVVVIQTGIIDFDRQLAAAVHTSGALFARLRMAVST